MPLGTGGRPEGNGVGAPTLVTSARHCLFNWPRFPGALIFLQVASEAVVVRAVSTGVGHCGRDGRYPEEGPEAGDGPRLLVLGEGFRCSGLCLLIGAVVLASTGVWRAACLKPYVRWEAHLLRGWARGRLCAYVSRHEE